MFRNKTPTMSAMEGTLVIRIFRLQEMEVTVQLGKLGLVERIGSNP